MGFWGALVMNSLSHPRLQTCLAGWVIPSCSWSSACLDGVVSRPFLTGHFHLAEAIDRKSMEEELKMLQAGGSYVVAWVSSRSVSCVLFEAAPRVPLFTRFLMVALSTSGGPLRPMVGCALRANLPAWFSLLDLFGRAGARGWEVDSRLVGCMFCYGAAQIEWTWQLKLAHIDICEHRQGADEAGGRGLEV
jgi:hypothetical protein